MSGKRPDKAPAATAGKTVKVAVDPVTRIEGHLKVEVEVQDGKVVDARCSGGMYRGFENILVGRDPRDASQLVQRICGVCPTAHATASVLALDDAFGVKPTTNGRIARNLILGAN
ncbi:MAG: nickel-dependent hydrogenase large subunit, partial [Desulfovibrionales bacterium]